MSKGTSSIGTCMAFSAGLGVNQTEYEGLTWSASGEVTNIGELGVMNEVIKYNTLCDGVTHKRMGATDYGTMTVEMLFDSDNAAQVIIQAAADNKTPLSARLTFPLAVGNTTSDIVYFEAYVQQARTATGASSDTVRYNVTLEIDGEPVSVAAT